MHDRQRPTILCVDDEPRVLEGLSMHLGRQHEVLTATSGREGLDVLRERSSVAVVISDMRMPLMDGATFLAQARQLAPHAVRMLLTGQTEVEAAIDAVNEGQIFRFLTKPCPPPTLQRAIDAALEQHRLIHAERVLLEQTLHGSIRALTDVLAMVDPISFGRANRIKRMVSELCAVLGVAERWQVEVAAMLSQLGYITLPTETVEKLERGLGLDAHEQQMVAKLPGVTEQLLANIPRLEVVRELLAGLLRKQSLRASLARDDLRTTDLRRASAILRVAVDYDAMDTRGVKPPAILAELRSRAGRYDEAVLQALTSLHAKAEGPGGGRNVRLDALRVGMVFAEDVRSKTGILLAARGFEVTDGFIQRVQNLRTGSVPETVRIADRDGESKG